MAKTKQAAAAAVVSVDLENTLTVDDTVYNINAVKADSATKLTTDSVGDTSTPVYFSNGVPVACTSVNTGSSGAGTTGKVTNPLKIYNYAGPADQDTTIDPVSFTGEKSESIRIVPATGGGFRGPVTIRTLDETKYSKPDLAILNRGQINSAINAVSGSSFYTWNGSTLTKPTENTSALRIETIVGTTANYAKLIKSTKQPTAYIYICSDGNNDVYFNYSPDYTNKKLVLGDVILSDITKGITDNATYIRNMVSGTQLVGEAKKADSLKIGTAFQDGTYFQKKITTSPNAPSGGSDGDIWIKY